MLKKIALTILFLTPKISLAFFCPTNFNQIDFGLTPDQVMQTCGKPDDKKEFTKANENIPQEWSYFVPQTLLLKNNTQQAQGTYKMTVAFNEQGNVINISINGIGVGSTPLCNGVQLGDTKDRVKASCGEPGFITKQAAPNNPTDQQDTKILEFTYSSVNPPITLIFENGKLADKK